MALGNHEALATEVVTNNYLVRKVYIDAESSVDVMYYWTFQKMGLGDQQLMPVRTPLVGFGGHVVHPEGMIVLTITIGKFPRSRILQVNFTVVKTDTPYNILHGRPTLNTLRVIFLTYHLSLKFPTPHGVFEVTSNVREARECYLGIMQPASSAALSGEPYNKDNTGSSSRSLKRDSVLVLDIIETLCPEKSVKL